MNESIEVSRRELFACPVWETDLLPVVDDLDRLRSDAAGYLDAHRVDEYPYEQSDGGFARSSEVWGRVAALIEGLGQRIIDDTFRVPSAYRVTGSRSWVVRTTGPADYTPPSGYDDLLHHHLPSPLSWVFGLQIPPEFEGSTELGTTFRAPSAELLRTFAGSAAYARFPAVTGRLLIFPGWLEHVVTLPGSEAEFSVPRMTIAGDLICRPG